MPQPRTQLNQDLTLIQTDELEKRLGNQFLKQHKQTSAGKLDELFIVKNSQQTIIGTARLEWLDNFYWLRNVYIEETSRHQGIGTLLIRAMFYTMAQHPTYCFAYQHLTEFYQKLAFTLIATQELPPTLQEKFKRYQNQGIKISAMQFKPPKSS